MIFEKSSELLSKKFSVSFLSLQAVGRDTLSAAKKTVLIPVLNSFRPESAFCRGITKLAPWSKTKSAIKLAFQAGFVKSTHLAETKSVPICEICPEISGCRSLTS